MDNRGNINPTYVQRIVDAAILELTAQATVGEAWLSLFPDLRSTSVIGIKVNCLNASRLVSHKEMAGAIAKGLAQMPLGSGTFSENNVIVWDRSNNELTGNGGYTLNTGTTGWRCFGTDQSGVGYSATTWDVTGVSQNPSRLLSELCDYLINLAVLKHHSESEVSLSLKNHYGSIHAPGSLHTNLCDPYIAALNRTIRQILPGKQALAMVDCLYGCYSGGPSGPPHLATAASYGLGTNDPAGMDVRTITNP